MAAKRQSTTVIAAVVSVALGTLFLRFLRARAGTRRRDEIAKPGMAAAQHRAEQVSPDPLSEGVLLSRIEDNFASGYQTMTAIIQGVALVVLVTTSAHAVFGSASSSQVATAASQAVAVFVIIIITTDQFFQLTAATRWLPSTIDTAIPYLAGPARRLRHCHWATTPAGGAASPGLCWRAPSPSATLLPVRLQKGSRASKTTTGTSSGTCAAPETCAPHCLSLLLP